MLGHQEIPAYYIYFYGQACQYLYLLKISDANHSHYFCVTFPHSVPTTLWQTFPHFWSNLKWQDWYCVLTSMMARKWFSAVIFIWHECCPWGTQSFLTCQTSPQYSKKINLQILNFHVNLCPKFDLTVSIPEVRGLHLPLSPFTVVFPPLELLIHQDASWVFLWCVVPREVNLWHTVEYFNVLVLLRKWITPKIPFKISFGMEVVTNYLLSRNLKEDPNKLFNDRSLKMFLMHHCDFHIYSEGDQRTEESCPNKNPSIAM